ncbi:MAG: TolC family protein [Deltaproteobacteria bacterium]|nr:TolC family protein [Deltaproteobacteria bacterium]
MIPKLPARALARRLRRSAVLALALACAPPLVARARAEAPPADDARLAEPVDRATIERAVLARHPSLVAATHRERALAASARAEGRLPPPELMTQIQQVPLARPYRLDQASMAMFGVAQDIPAPGMLDLQAEAMDLEARAAGAMASAQARMLVREVGHAFAQYAEATARQRVRRETLALLGRMSEVARARYATGAPLADFTRAELEDVRAQAEIAREQGMAQEARAMLNGLMARPIDAPLGPPQQGEPQTVVLEAAAVAERAAQRHPEVLAAELMVRAAERAARAAEREASVPMFKVAVGGFLPVGEMPAGWGASFGTTLPWLWGRAVGRSESAERRVRVEQAGADAVRVRVRAEVARAFAALGGAERRWLLLGDLARPAARRAIETSEAGYAAGGSDLLGWLDAVRSALEVELDLAMARADLERALVDLDWAAGAPVARVGLESPFPTNPTEKQP